MTVSAHYLGMLQLERLGDLVGDTTRDALRVGRAEVEDHVRRPGGDVALGHRAGGGEIVGIDPDLHRALDLRRVAPNRAAVLVEHGVLVLETLDRPAGEVPDVGVLRRDPEGELLAPAADDDGRVGLLYGLRLAARV